MPTKIKAKGIFAVEVEFELPWEGTPTTVSVIAAEVNVKLEEAIKEGKFRFSSIDIDWDPPVSL